jgi:hypothetical protein
MANYFLIVSMYFIGIFNGLCIYPLLSSLGFLP